MGFKYQAYYKYDPNKYTFMLDELSEEQIALNMALLLGDLKSHFSKNDEAVELSLDGVISITTYLTQKQCDDVVAGYLSSLQLCANKLP